MKTGIQVILVVAIVVLTYLLWESIAQPIRFNKERGKRYEAVIQRLKDIRSAQIAYKSVYGKFTADFDSLITSVKQDSFSVVKAIGSVPDSITEAEAVKLGIVSRDTVKIPIRDSLFVSNYFVDSLKFVPYTAQAVFELGATQLETVSAIKVWVFEAKVPNTTILNGMNMQLIGSENAERKKLNKYPGLKVGSLTETTNNAGNWE